MDDQKKGHGVTWAVVVVVLALAAYGGYKYMGKSGSGSEVNTTPTTNTPVTGVSFKDGNYNAVGNYNSPGGAEEIGVAVTLKDGVITSVNATSLATRKESKEWQGKFVSGVGTAVVGKKITEVNLTKVSGSSLTPKGWNDAIAKIISQAQA